MMGDNGSKQWLDELRSRGALSDNAAWGREALYEGRFGTVVERFRDDAGSYVLKPIGDPATVGRELWVQQTIVPALGGIRVPGIVAAGQGEADGGNWLVYEDLGRLRHCRTADELIEAAGWIADWQLLPAEWVPASFAGHTPAYQQVLEQLSERSPMEIADWLERDADSVAAWHRHICDHARARIGDELVIAHGDYYPGNIAIRDGERVVLDWEYIHLNHPYWDLYSLLDITSYRYAKIPLAQEERIAAIGSYWERMELCVTMREDRMKPEGSFEESCSGYWMFASLYSAWIAGLIAGDLQRGQLPREALLRQRQETIQVFADCLGGLRLA